MVCRLATRAWAVASFHEAGAATSARGSARSPCHSHSFRGGVGANRPRASRRRTALWPGG